MSDSARDMLRSCCKSSDQSELLCCVLWTLDFRYRDDDPAIQPWTLGDSSDHIDHVIRAIAVVALQPGGRILDLTVNFATQAPTPLVAVTQRVLAEMSWAGSGAGTFAAILPIYQGIDELAIGQVAPTAAAAIAIEMGWPIFWAILIAAIALVFLLLRGALRRQRDSYYSMAGAGCTVATALLSFGSFALLTTPISIIVAVAIGIAIAQSKSRLS